MEHLAMQLNKMSTDIDKIKFIAKHPNEFILVLDNDNTSIAWANGACPDGTDYYDMPEIGNLTECIGQSKGVINLLTIIGINSEFC
jgi:hypothetical protein